MRFPLASVLTENGEGKGCTIRGELSNSELTEPSTGYISLAPPPLDGKISYEAALGEARARMKWKSDLKDSAPAVCLVVDGSESMNKAGIDWKALCYAIPSSCRFNAVFAGQRPEKWRENFIEPTQDNKTSMANWIGDHSFMGGCDSTRALERAWDLAAAVPGAIVLWIHGPQPLLLHSPDGLLQRYRRRPYNEREKKGVKILSLAVAPGPCRLMEKLADPKAFERVEVFGSLEGTFAYVGKNLRGADGVRAYELALDGEVLPVSENRTVPATTHLARLAVFKKIQGLIPGFSEKAISYAAALAVKARLVTHFTGAVVLETKEQYERHDLDPYKDVKRDSIPAIPEPAEWALIVLGLILLWIVFRRKKAALCRIP
jgi:hypothetical protein